MNINSQIFTVNVDDADTTSFFSISYCKKSISIFITFRINFYALGCLAPKINNTTIIGAIYCTDRTANRTFTNYRYRNFFTI